jgi:hypothetical protein
MPSQPSLPVEISQFLEVISGSATVAERLIRSDASFRGLCEDFKLAQATLNTLESLQGAHILPKIAEYRRLVAELGNEIATVLDNAKRPQ